MVYNCDIGNLSIKITEGCINEVTFLNEDIPSADADSLSYGDNDHLVMEECTRQLNEYFSGKRNHFNLPLKQQGTVFQQRVWAELLQIPFGRTLTYRELSRRLGDVKAIRAVGSANSKNQLAILVPCHRVIGADGSLTGYAGGLERKKWLLDHENQVASAMARLF